MLRFTLILFLSILLVSCQYQRPENARVQIQKINGQARFTIDGQVHEIKGLAGHTHLQEAHRIGANTIRTYDTTGLEAILDSAHHHGLKVVAGIWLPKSHVPWLYHSEEHSNKLGKELVALGRKYRDHPALLSWCLGNELIFYDLSDFSFSRTYNRLLDSLRSGDPEHPIGTAFANYGHKAILNFALKIRSIDYLIINTFGRLPKLSDDMDDLDWLWSKPFLIGEFGENGPWETEWTKWGAPLEPSSSQKAEITHRRFKELPGDHPQFLGALFFNWGWRHEQTHTWFNVFSKKGERSALYYELALQYGNSSIPTIPKIESLKIDGTKKANDLWFESNEWHTAQIELPENLSADSLKIEWSVRTEDWFFLKADSPPPLPDLIEYSEDRKSIKFRCPPKAGPFRLFVSIHDQKGHFASANLPFYVVR
ncbi:hypothetical protein [Croceimicrobium sp.]|uniref:hypothetical protein n=1 Tax=Croceimicrobium sp. TaxID=2828340 RepID=UPI003BAD1B57